MLRASAFQAEGRELESHLVLNDVSPDKALAVTTVHQSSGVDAALSRQRSRVRIPYEPQYNSSVAQRQSTTLLMLGSGFRNSPGEQYGIWPSWLRHYTDNVEIPGSTPGIPTLRSITQW